LNPILLLTFWGVTTLLIVVPGPDWALILATGAGQRAVLPAVGGLMIGYSALTLLVAAGVGALVGRSPILLTALTVVGAGYLSYLGFSLLRHPASRAGDDSDVRRAGRSPLLRGVSVSGLNPKGLLVFVAVLPQFSDADGSWPLGAQLATLGLVFVLTCGAFYAVLGYSARTVLGARPAAARMVSRVSGGAMIVVGIVLLLERIFSARSSSV
jgi:threonine/homoserine/homoserine lactone efflux protein